jgi:hypothetical protein
MKTRSDSLRRKAYRLHRKADQARANGRAFDAASLRASAFNMEADADTAEAAELEMDAGFDDHALDGLTSYTAQPRIGGQR